MPERPNCAAAERERERERFSGQPSNNFFFLKKKKATEILTFPINGPKDRIKIHKTSGYFPRKRWINLVPTISVLETPSVRLICL